MSVVQSSISKLLRKARELFTPQNIAKATPVGIATSLARKALTTPIGPRQISIAQAAQQTAPNVASGFGRALSGQGVLPKAYSSSVGQYIGNFGQNLVGGIPSIIDPNKSAKQKAVDVGTSVATAYSAGQGLPGIAQNLAGIGIGTGLNYLGSKATGQPFDFQKSLADTQRMAYQSAGVVGATNPLLAQVMGKAKVASPLIQRGVAAGLNVGQGLGIDVATGQQTTPASVGIDVAMGLLGGPGQFGKSRSRLGQTPTGSKSRLQVKPTEEIPQIAKTQLDEAKLKVNELRQQALNPNTPKTRQNALNKAADELDGWIKQQTTTNIFGQTIPVPPKGQAGFVDLNANTNVSNVISEARKSIGTLKQEQGKSLRENADEIYRDWVNKYAPLETVGREAKARLRVKGAELRPEYDPEYALKRVLGMGGIANYKYDSELKPIIDEANNLKIDKVDLDAYLKARRDVGFGKAGRDIYGSDPVKASQQVAAFEQKYGPNIANVAQKLYDYQNRLLDQLADSGFISKDKLNIIRQQNPDYVPFQRVIDDNLVDEFVGIGKKSIQQATSPIARIKGSEKQVYSPLESIIGNTYRYTSAIEKNNFVKKFLALENDIPQLKFDLADKAGDDTISVWIDGRKQYRRVGEDVAKAVKGLDQETMGLIERILSAPATLLRTGATGMNPEFMGPNVIRDQFEASLNSKYGYVPFVDYFRGLAHLINKDRTGSDALVDSWLANGGAQEFANISGRKSVSELIDSKEAKKGLFAWLANGLEKMGRYSEIPTRLGLYKKALKATKNPTIAAFESREGTMDFARMGAKMKVANSLIPFLNVQVQGLDKIIRNVVNKPAQSLVLAGLYGVAPQVMTSAYNLMFYPQEYSEIPQYEKDGNLIIVVGRGDDGQVKYLSFPKANSLQLVQNPIENFMAYAAGANPQSFSEMATSLISSSLPVVGDGASIGEVGLKTVGNLIPQAVKPLAEVLLNKSFFKYNTDKEEAKEIVPYYLKKLPSGEQAYQWTPALYKGVGQLLNVSPLQVQTIAEGYLAGFTKIPNQIVDVLNSISKGERVSPNDVTILRRFVKETYPTTKSTSSTTSTQPSTGLVQKANASGFFGWFAPREQKIETDPTVIRARMSARPDTLKGQELANYYLREIKLDNQSAYETAIAEKKIWSRLSDLESSDSLSDQQKSETRALLLEKVGITPQDYKYYEVAKQDNPIKSLYAKEELTKLLTSGADRQQIYNWLVDNRREVNGKQVLAPGVIDELVDANIISYADGAALKKLEVTGTGQKRAIKAKSGKAKKIKLPKPKKISFKVSVPKVKKIAAKKFKVKKMKNVSIKLKQRKIA